MSVCSLDGCDEPHCAKGLCKRHYYAAKRAAARAQRPPKPPPATCAVQGCSERVQARGWCGAHYQRWRRFGDPTFAPPPADKRCTVEGCNGVTNARGLCSTHYYFWRTYGDPLQRKNRERVTPVVTFALRPCVTCGQMFDPGRSPARRYCGSLCRPSRRASVGVNKRETVERLGREDGWVCGLCGRVIDPARYWPDPEAGSVDHITPVISGGTDDRSNLRLTHLRCNVQRGNEQRRATSSA